MLLKTFLQLLVQFLNWKEAVHHIEKWPLFLFSCPQLLNKDTNSVLTSHDNHEYCPQEVRMQLSFYTMLSAVSTQCTGMFSSLFSYGKLRRLQNTSNYQCELLNKIYLYSVILKYTFLAIGSWPSINVYQLTSLFQPSVGSSM